MKRSYIKELVKEELQKIKNEAAGRAVSRGTVTDNTRLAMVLSSLGKRAKGSFQKSIDKTNVKIFLNQS